MQSAKLQTALEAKMALPGAFANVQGPLNLLPVHELAPAINTSGISRYYRVYPANLLLASKKAKQW